MNRNQIEFSQYWDKISSAAFYKVAVITKTASFSDKILDNQRKELAGYIKEEIIRTFFDDKMRPEATVWLECLKKEFPQEAEKFEAYVKSCEFYTMGNESILTVAGAGTAAVVGAAIGKKRPFVSAILTLGGFAVAGYKIASGLCVDTETLQKEVKEQFEIWKIALLHILKDCDDADSI